MPEDLENSVSAPKVGQTVHHRDFDHPMMVKSVNKKNRTVELLCMAGTPSTLSEVSFEELFRKKLETSPAA